MPILFDKEGQAYEVGTYQQVNVEDYRADLARLEDEYQDKKRQIQEKIDFLQETLSTDVPAAPEAPAQPETPSNVGVIDSPAPQSYEEAPAQPAQVIQDVTPSPITTVDESAPVITVTESTPQVTTIEDASPTPQLEQPAPQEPAQPVVITLQ